MKLSEIVKNLENTIAGKVALRDSYQECISEENRGSSNFYALNAAIQFINLNIKELKDILTAVKSVKQ